MRRVRRDPRSRQIEEPLPRPRTRRLIERFEIVHTPKHGSWLNMADCELSVLEKRALGERVGHATQLHPCRTAQRALEMVACVGPAGGAARNSRPPWAGSRCCQPARPAVATDGTKLMACAFGGGHVR